MFVFKIALSLSVMFFLAQWTYISSLARTRYLKITCMDVWGDSGKYSLYLHESRRRSPYACCTFFYIKRRHLLVRLDNYVPSSQPITPCVCTFALFGRFQRDK